MIIESLVEGGKQPAFFEKSTKLKQIRKLSSQLEKLKETLVKQEVSEEDYKKWVHELAKQEGEYYE